MMNFIHVHVVEYFAMPFKILFNLERIFQEYAIHIIKIFFKNLCSRSHAHEIMSLPSRDPMHPFILSKLHPNLLKFKVSRSPKTSKKDPYNLKKKLKIYISITHINLKFK